VTQTGVVGAILFLGFLLAAVAAAWRVRRSPEPLRRAAVAGSAIGFAYWFIHAAGDWLWAIPALGGAAFAWLGMAIGLASTSGPTVRLAADVEAAEFGPVASLARRQRIALAAVAVFAIAALATLAPPWLAASAVDEAGSVWRQSPAEAFDLLERARALNVLSDRPDLVAGVIASRLGERRRARRSFARAVVRSPRNWYAHQQLGIEEALAGRRRTALTRLRRARELNPREETTQLLLRQVRAGSRPVPDEIRAVFLDRVCSRVPSARLC